MRVIGFECRLAGPDGPVDHLDDADALRTAGGREVRPASDAGRTCVIVSPADPTSSYVYYPVTVRSDQPIRLTGIGPSPDSDVDATGTWVAPRGRITAEGLIRGGTGSTFLQSRNLRWGDRTKASGAALRAHREYTVFLQLRVPAGARPHHVGGLVVSYRDATGPGQATWVDDVDFRRHC